MMNEPSISAACLICADTPANAHFGVLSCRACSAFFSRSVSENRIYSCLSSGNCVIEKSQKFLCRECRLKKCFDVGMLLAGIKGKRLKRNEEDEPIFLQKMAENYKILCEERKRTEQALFPEQYKNAQESGPIPGYFLGTVDTIRMSNKVHFPAVVEYLSNTFEEFSELTKEQKWQLIKPFYVYLQWIDCCYMTVQTVPYNLYSQFNIISPTTYFDAQMALDNWFSVENAPDFMKEKLTKYMPEFVRKECSPDKIRSITQMYQLKVTEMEIGGLVGLMFWNCNIIENCVELLPLISRVRTRILKEFGLYYKKLGIPCPEVRQGEVLNLLTLILIAARRFRNNLQLFNVFGMLDKGDFFYKLIHELQ